MNQDQDYEIDAVENSSDDVQTGGETNRRELLLTAGALGIAAMLGTASASAQGNSGEGRGERPAFGPEMFSHENLSNFAGLTAKIWGDPELAIRYEREPRKVLKEYNVDVPKGVPTPIIPKPPKGGMKNIEEAWQRNEFGAADMLIREIGKSSMRSYTTNTQSCMSTLGCPVSTCNCFFCYIVARGKGGEIIRRRDGEGE